MKLPKFPSLEEEIKSDISHDNRSSSKIISKDREGLGPKLPQLPMSFDDEYLEPVHGEIIKQSEEEMEVEGDNRMPLLEDLDNPPNLQIQDELEVLEDSWEEDAPFSEYVEPKAEDEGIPTIVESESVEDIIGGLVDQEFSVNELDNDEDLDYAEDSDFYKIETPEEDTLKVLGDDNGHLSVPAYSEESDDEDFSEDFETSEITADEDDYEDDYEEDYEEEDDYEEEFSFLPGVTEPEPIEVDDAPEIKSSKMANNELDDEKVKAFFMDIKNKIFKGKSKNDKPKSDKQSKYPNKSKIKGNKKPGKKKGIDIKGIGLKFIFIAIFIGLIAFGLLFYQNGFSSLSEIELKPTSGEDISLHINEMSSQSDEIEFTIANNADISAGIILNMEFREKSLIPFMETKILCSSDIIALEPGMTLTESSDCLGLNPDGKYRVNVDVVELP